MDILLLSDHIHVLNLSCLYYLYFKWIYLWPHTTMKDLINCSANEKEGGGVNKLLHIFDFSEDHRKKKRNDSYARTIFGRNELICSFPMNKEIFRIVRIW